MTTTAADTKPKKSQPKGGSRKGIPNKVGTDIKAMVLEALKGVGGVDYLCRQAEEKPVAFLGLVGKVLPLQVLGELNHTGGITVNIKQF